MLCAICTHAGLHGFHELPFIIWKFHIDKVSHDDSAKVPEPELACNFFSSFQVGLQCILFLVITDTFVTTVYINYVKCLGMFNDQIGSAGQVNCFTKSSFYLFGNPEMIKNR